MKELFSKYLSTLLLFAASNIHGISYSSIDDNCRALTTAQYDEYVESLEGESVDWEGKIVDVQSKFFSFKYCVTVDMDGDGSHDVLFNIDKSGAMELTKGKEYEFKGKIEHIERDAGKCTVRLKDTSIENSWF